MGDSTHVIDGDSFYISNDHSAQSSTDIVQGSSVLLTSNCDGKNLQNLREESDLAKENHYEQCGKKIIQYSKGKQLLVNEKDTGM